ncbi:MAG: hypothetical protein WAO76_17790 [Georgfuchsia sp.]
MKLNKDFIGADFDDFLREEGILEDVEAGAVKKVVTDDFMAERLMNRLPQEPGIFDDELVQRDETGR